MDIMSWLQIVQVAGSALVCIISTLIAIRQGHKDKLKEIVKGNAPDYIQEAEKMFGSGKGVEKASYVLTKLTIDALTCHVKFKAGELESYITELVDMSNVVNVNKK